jgi:GH25 family lysozyme M1 (1,4-beta-N-acetylmuramidase)
MTDPRSRILAEARACLGMGGPEPWATEMGIKGALPSTSYCGLGVRAVWRRAGLVVPDWKIGSANLKGLVKTTSPEPGDLIQWRGDLGHQSLFVRRDGSIVEGIDWNTTGKNLEGKLVASTVAEKRRASADVLAYYAAPIASAKVGPVPSPARGSTESGLPADQCRGIDLSEHQAVNAVDWHAAARLGYRYGIARLTNGTTRDTRCVEHCRRIRDAGLILGGYIFHVYWRTPSEMVEAFLRDSEACGYGLPGDQVPWLDLESWQGASGYHQAVPAWSPVAEETAARLAECFGSVGIYLNASDWAAMGCPTWIGRYPLACAHYTAAAEPLTAGGLQWTWWQHRVAPIPGVCTVRIDQSIARLPLPTIRQTEAQPAHHGEQRVDTGWIDVPWDRTEHARLRNLAVARHTDEEPP